MKIGAIILSRFNSSRLPGKALMNVGEKTVLGHIIHSLKQNLSLEVIVATSNEATDDPIASWCLDQNVNCFRGSLNNVAERFLECATANELDYALRINGDNFCVCKSLIQDTIKVCKSNQFDLISNVIERTYPFGMSVEALKVRFYQSLITKINTKEYYKEHVTSYLYEHLNEINSCSLLNKEYPKLKGVKLALDTKEDYVKILKLYKYLHANNLYPLVNLEEFETIIDEEKYLGR